MNKFYAFYTWAYGMERRCETFETADEVEAFYAKVAKDKASYLGLMIIYGELCEFDPVEVVEQWRLRD